MHYIDIYALLVKKDTTLAEVAKSEGVSPSFVSKVIRGNRHSYSVAAYIAAVTDVPLQRLWPEQYRYAPRELRRKAA